MNILWDFRLFSYGYADRGVGSHALTMARAILDAGPEHTIYIWGEKQYLPACIGTWPVTIINYKKSNWKWDLLTIPLLMRKYSIDLLHYWIALGPIPAIGLGLFHPGAVCLTIHDTGALTWTDDPACTHVSKSLYIKIQKLLIRQCAAIGCVSYDTASIMGKLFPPLLTKIQVIYPPFTSISDKPLPPTRQNYFITLGGAVRKNLTMVVQAFLHLHKTIEGISLVVCGDLCDEEKHDLTKYALHHSTISFDTMDHYHDHLAQAAGLVVCSWAEGLGHPPIEAMMHKCPIVLSDIAPFHETCENAARFVDHTNIQSIAQGMGDVLENRTFWEESSAQGALVYSQKSVLSGRAWLDIYKSAVQ